MKFVVCNLLCYCLSNVIICITIKSKSGYLGSVRGAFEMLYWKCRAAKVEIKTNDNFSFSRKYNFPS